jgi:hypothetical protein
VGGFISTEIGIKSSGSIPCPAYPTQNTTKISPPPPPKNHTKKRTSSISKCVQCILGRALSSCGCSVSMTCDSHLDKSAFVHIALTRIEASRQEHTTTRYAINVRNGGSANFPSSKSTTHTWQREGRMNRKRGGDTQQYRLRCAGTDANVLLGSFSLNSASGFRCGQSRSARVSAAGLEGAQRRMVAYGWRARIWRVVSARVLYGDGEGQEGGWE